MSAKQKSSSDAGGVTASSGQLFRSRREATLLLALLLALGTLALYEPAFHNGFTNFDDPDYITENAHVRQGLSWGNVGWSFRATTAYNWHPVTWISHMADVEVFGLKPAGHHMVSVVLHIVNVILLFLLLLAATGYLLRSAMVAALFGVLPLNVEAVAWAAERKSVLCTTFLLLSFFAYGWYARKPGAGRYLTLVLLFAIGLMAKPMVITLPFLLLLADYWPLKRFSFAGDKEAEGESSGPGFMKLVTEKIPLFVMAAASGVITVYVQRQGGAVASTELFPLGLRIENAVFSYIEYILKGMWPTRLAVFYPHPENTLAVWKVAGAGLVLLAITVAAWRYREKRYLLTGWLWYVGTMVPVIGIIQVGRQAMADRYAYIPFVGLFVIAVWLVADWATRLHAPRAAVALLALIVISGYAWATHVQIAYWHDSYSLFTHALEVTTRNGMAEDNLGVALVTMGRPELALPHFMAAVEYTPDISRAHFDLATVLQKQNQMVPAMNEYKLAIAHTADPQEASWAHNNLATLFLQAGQPGQALAEYNEALRINPEETHSLLGRGTLEYREGNLDAAKEDFARAAQLTSTGMNYALLGRVLEAKGELTPAMSAYETALRLAPDLTDARTHLDAVRHRLQP
jgi:protein O-mannosyl-transferase